MGSDGLHSSTLTSPLRTDGETMMPGYVLVGRYRIDELLGRGGMGAVFSATQINTGLSVAVKVLHPEFSQRNDLIRRFAAEARAAASLRHPGIVRVIDFDREANLHFLVMEKLEGQSLADRLDRADPLPEVLVAQIGADICDAIAAAHRCTPKIIHRDLKPENVFLATEGRREGVVKILDFGVAKLVDAEHAGPDNLTGSGVVAGTPCYMSPEQLLSSRDVDERSDSHSIGVILFQSLTKSLPHDASSLGELILKVHNEPAPPILSLRPDISPQLAAVVDRALARDREQRFQTADELRVALESVIAGRAASPSRSRARSLTPRRAAMVAAPVGLLAAAGLGLWWSGFWDAPPVPPPPARSAMDPAPSPRAPELGAVLAGTLPPDLGRPATGEKKDGGLPARLREANIVPVSTSPLASPRAMERPKKRTPSTHPQPEASPPAGVAVPADERPKFRE